jgi:protein phosphatase
MVQSRVAVVDPANVGTVKVPPGRPPLAVRSFGLTHPGKVRGSNEDQFLIASLRKSLHVQGTSLPQPKVQHSSDQCHLFIVADGMGGHAAGEHASALAIDSVESFVLETFKWFAECRSREQDRVLADFQSALGQANARVLAEAQAHPQWHGMGTTMTLAYSLNDDLFVAHAGDSRCYLCRAGKLYRLTSDHTLVEEMVKMGTIPAEEAPNHHWRHVITNAIGGNSPEIKVEVHKLRLQPDDRLLVCSDGLTTMVSDQDIAGILHGQTDPEQACRQLVGLANEAGGLDNTTVIVARYEAVADDDRVTG